MGFSELYLSFDKLIENLLEVNFDYRNFLAWINNFNNKENNPNYNAAAKNYLNNISYDYSHCFKFICESHYNMEHILKQIDRENDEAPVQKLCYEITKACENIDWNNVKQMDDSIMIDGQPVKIADLQKQQGEEPSEPKTEGTENPGDL